MSKRKLAVQYFASSVLVVTVDHYRIYLGYVLFYSSFSQPYLHTSPCAPCGPPTMSAVATWSTFFRFVLFWLRRCGVGFPWEISIGISAWTTCIFVQTCFLAKFRGFSLFWWLLWVWHPVIHNGLWHRRLACTCRGSQLFSFLEVLENNSCNSFYGRFSWGRTIVCPDAFVLHSKISSRSVFDDVWWPILIYGNTGELYVSVTSNLQIKQSKNLSKNWFFSIQQS